jgi:hypothetical protein
MPVSASATAWKRVTSRKGCSVAAWSTTNWRKAQSKDAGGMAADAAAARRRMRIVVTVGDRDF